MSKGSTYACATVATMMLLLIFSIFDGLRGEPRIELPAAVKSAQAKLRDNPTAGNYGELAFQYYQAKSPARSAEAGREAVRLSPHELEYANNLCAAYNDLHQYQQAILACENALQIDATSQLAKNNLLWAQSH
jgi:tetratricopeptide (TPR) repeat protein